jgi:hypothetical protein
MYLRFHIPLKNIKQSYKNNSREKIFPLGGGFNLYGSRYMHMCSNRYMYMCGNRYMYMHGNRYKWRGCKEFCGVENRGLH